jgi:hypothetical protein
VPLEILEVPRNMALVGAIELIGWHAPKLLERLKCETQTEKQ